MIVYVGPDQIIPLSGFLGTAVGLALMFWGKVTEGVRRLSTKLVPSKSEVRSE
jgi:hypothetical protein